MRSSIHQKIIEDLSVKVPGFSTMRFRRKVEAIVTGINYDTVNRTTRKRDSEFKSDFWPIPDGFVIKKGKKLLTIYEVEVVNRRKTIDKYEQVWWLLDDFGWEISIVIVDRFGNQSVIDESVVTLRMYELLSKRNYESGLSV